MLAPFRATLPGTVGTSTPYALSSCAISGFLSHPLLLKAAPGVRLGEGPAIARAHLLGSRTGGSDDFNLDNLEA